MLIGCSEKRVITDSSGVSLPPPPAFMNPVAVPKLRRDQDARDALGRSRNALKQANSRLSKSRAWYIARRKEFAGK